MSWKKVKFKDFLIRSKIPIEILDNQKYKRVTIRINHNGISLRDIIDGKKIGTKKQFILKEGQFVLSKIDARYGAFGIAPTEVQNGIITGNFWAFDVNKNIIDIDWFNQYTNSKSFYDICERASSGITHRKYLNEKVFSNFEILLPDLETQKRIISEIKETNNKFNSLLIQHSYQLNIIKKLRQQILKDAIQGKLVHQNAEDEPASKLLKKIKDEKERLIKEKKIKREKGLAPISEDELSFVIPKNWEWCRLGEICIKISDGFHNTPPKIKEGYPYIAATHVKSEKIDWDNCYYVAENYHKELYAKTFPQKGEILIVNIGAGSGTPAIIDVDFEFSFKNTAILKFNQDLITNKILFYFFILKRDDIYINLTKGGLQPFLSLKLLNGILFPLPPLAEQQRIVKRVDELMDLCNKLEESIIRNQEITERLYQSALKEALQPKETKKIELLPNYCDVPKRTILAGYILNQCHTEDFGRVKFMKLLYLVEHICYLDFNSQYIKKAAGPYDENLIREIEQKLSQMQFYQIQQDKKDNRRVHYTRLGCTDELDSLFATHFANEKGVVDGLLAKFKNSTWDQCEIIATLYAVWNNRIIQNELINDALLKQDFLSWDKNKAKYKDRLDAALDWMRNNGIVPNGYGKLIERPYKSL